MCDVRANDIMCTRFPSTSWTLYIQYFHKPQNCAYVKIVSHSMTYDTYYIKAYDANDNELPITYDKCDMQHAYETPVASIDTVSHMSVPPKGMAGGGVNYYATWSVSVVEGWEDD